MCLLAVSLGAALLAGCDAAPLPEAAMLKPQPAPRCEAPRERKGSGAAGVESAEAAVGKAAGASDEAARLHKLDYQAQCYRHAEMIARSRLGRLQASVEDIARAEKAKNSAPPPTPF